MVSDLLKQKNITTSQSNNESIEFSPKDSKEYFTKSLNVTVTSKDEKERKFTALEKQQIHKIIDIKLNEKMKKELAAQKEEFQNMLTKQIKKTSISPKQKPDLQSKFD